MANLMRVFFGSVRRAQVSLALILLGVIAVLVDPTIPHVVLHRTLAAAQPAIQCGINAATSFLVAIAPIVIMLWLFSRAFKGVKGKK